MSNFIAPSRHFGRHVYGVRFSDGRIFHEAQVESIGETWCRGPIASERCDMNLIEAAAPFFVGAGGYVRDTEGRCVLTCAKPGCARLWVGYYPPARTATCPDCGTRWRDLSHVDPVSVDSLLTKKAPDCSGASPHLRPGAGW